MTLYHGNYTNGAQRVPVPESAGEVVALRFKHTLTTTQNTAANILELGVLPAHFRPVGAKLICDDLDEGSVAALLLDIGLMSGNVGEALDEAGNARTSDDEFFVGATTGQGGGVAESAEKDMFNIAAVAYDRSIGLKIATGPATAALGDVELIVLCAS